MRPLSGQFVVHGRTALRRGKSCDRDTVYRELPLTEELLQHHARFHQLGGVTRKRIDDCCTAYGKGEQNPVVETGPALDDTRQVARSSIHEVEHRGDRIAERIGRRQQVETAIESLDAPFERYAQTLTRIGRGHGLRVVVGYVAARSPYRVAAYILRVRETHEAVESLLCPEAVGTV